MSLFPLTSKSQATHTLSFRSICLVFSSIMATVVIIPGSFATPTLYEPLTQSLARDGVQSQIVDLPSVGRREGKEPATMTDDVNEISSVVEKLLDEDKDVVLLAHSYGGVPATQCLEKLSQKARQAEGKKSGVSKIVYLAGVALPVGGSVMSLLQPPEFLIIEVRSISLSSRPS